MCTFHFDEKIQSILVMSFCSLSMWWHLIVYNIVTFCGKPTNRFKTKLVQCINWMIFFLCRNTRDRQRDTYTLVVPLLCCYANSKLNHQILIHLRAKMTNDSYLRNIFDLKVCGLKVLSNAALKCVHVVVIFCIRKIGDENMTKNSIGFTHI